MIEKINKLIEQLRTSKDYALYSDLVYELHYFAIEVANSRKKLDISIANMEFLKAEYQIKNRDKYNSDRTASSYFKKDNYDKLQELEIQIAEVELLETLVNRYDRIQNHIHSWFLADMHNAKMLK